MNSCRETIRRIHEADGAFDRETLTHCQKCASCRRELEAVVSAASSDAPGIPASLDRSTLAACRNGRRRRLRFRVERAVAWSGAAAAVVLCLFSINLRSPEPAVEASVPEWDASELFGELSDIGDEITRTQKLFAADNTFGDAESSI